VTNGIDDDGDTWVDEAFGHGTHLSSIVVLLNPDARILPLRVLDAEGNGDSFDVADAIYYAVDHGAQVINLSLSMKTPSTAVALAMEYARFAGVPVFTSAGNNGKEKVLFPGNYDPSTMDFDFPFLPVGWAPSEETVTTVAATDECNKKADFSAYGLDVNLVAPGVNIYGAMPGGGYAWWSGTSMSTAVASGVASLVLSVAGPDLLTPPQHVLMYTAKPVDWLNPDYQGLLGVGSIDAGSAAWEAAKPGN
jgi:subtilisin family serine protease